MSMPDVAQYPGLCVKEMKYITENIGRQVEVENNIMPRTYL